MAPGMNPSSSAPGSRSSRPQSQQMTSQSGHGQGMFRPDHPFLQQRGPSYQPQKPAQPARLPQPPTRGRGNSSDTTASTQTSGSSEVGSLTESTSVNIIRKQGQYVDAASAKEELHDTPRQQFAPQVAVRDEIDVHLEHLFVSILPSLLWFSLEMLTIRIRSKYPMRSERNSAPSRPTSNPPSSPRPTRPIPPSSSPSDCHLPLAALLLEAVAAAPPRSLPCENACPSRYCVNKSPPLPSALPAPRLRSAGHTESTGITLQSLLLPLL